MTQEELQKAKERLQNAESLKSEIDVMKDRIEYFDEILHNAKDLYCVEISLFGEKGTTYETRISNFMIADLSEGLFACTKKYITEVMELYKEKLKKLEEEFKNLSL